MKHILIATFNYYPTHSAGTERYVAELMRYLSDLNISATIVCSVEGARLKSHDIDHDLCIEKDKMAVYSWTWENIKVFGVEFFEFDRGANGCLHSKSDTKALGALKAYLPIPDEIWLHGGNRTSNLSLLEVFPDSPYRVWLHTAFGCPKGDLMAGEGEVCDKKVKLTTCTPCLLRSSGSGFRAKRKAAQAAMFSFWRGQQLNQLLSQADKVYSFTPEIIPHIENNLSDTTKIKIVPHGCDTKIISKLSHSEPVRFGFFGRLETEKGFDFLIQFWSSLTPDRNQRTLMLVGNEHDLRNEFPRFMNRTDLIIRPKVKPQDVPSLYGAIDVLLVPSKFLETGPLVVHEAVNSSCVVMASDHGGLKSLGKQYPEMVMNLPFGNVQLWTTEIQLLSSAQIEKKSSFSSRSSMTTFQHFDELFKGDLDLKKNEHEESASIR